MQFNAPTFRLPTTVPEGRYPPGVIVENELRVWAISPWRGARDLAEGFLRAGFHHLPAGSPRMFRLEELRPHAGATTTGYRAIFTNRFDAYYLLGQVFFGGQEFIAFTTYNFFTDVASIFPNCNIHSLPYYLGENGQEEEQE
jgi:hypothetical protein